MTVENRGVISSVAENRMGEFPQLVRMDPIRDGSQMGFAIRGCGGGFATTVEMACVIKVALRLLLPR